MLKAEDEFVKEHGVHKQYSHEDLRVISEIAHKLSKESPHTEEEEFSVEEVENVIENKIPSILTVNAVISGIVSHEVLKILHKQKGQSIGEIMSPSYLEYSSEYGIFTPIEIAKDENCPVCGKKEDKLRLILKADSTLGDMVTALGEKGVELGDMALITKVIDGAVIMAPAQGTLDRKLKELSIQNHDILRATYTKMEDDGTPRRDQKEFVIELED